MDTKIPFFSKRVFQENKARQIFRKTIIFYPLIRTCSFFGKFDVLCFLETPVLRKKDFCIHFSPLIRIQKSLFFPFIFDIE